MVSAFDPQVLRALPFRGYCLSDGDLRHRSCVYGFGSHN